MNKLIQIRTEAARKCGRRDKLGALYMVDFESELRPCGRLPVSLEVCPTCGCGPKPSRQWTWVDGDALLAPAKEEPCAAGSCSGCALSDSGPAIGRAGMLWVGEAFYPSPVEFMLEARAQGISRRVNFLPHGFKLGETWVILAHIRGTPDGKPGAFFVYRPRAVEVVCNGAEAPEVLEAYVKRGITPVVIREKATDEFAEGL